MTVLDCGNNPISSLQPLFGLPLNRLECNKCLLSGALDISGFQNLCAFDCGNNAITSLNLGQVLIVYIAIIIIFQN